MRNRAITTGEEIFTYGPVEHQTFFFAILAQQACAGSKQGTGRGSGEPVADNFDFSGSEAIQTENCAKCFGATRTNKPGDAEDFTRPEGECY